MSENKSKRAKYRTKGESMAASRAGLQRAAAMRAALARDRYYQQQFTGDNAASIGYRDWAKNVMNKTHGYENYRAHPLPPGGFPEFGRGGVWGPRTRPKAFVEKYDAGTHTVFLVPKTRGPAKVTGLMYSGARYPKGQLTKHYKRVVFNKAAEHADMTGKGKVPGGTIDEKYKWARGYLKRNKLGIPRKNRETMGPG